MPSVYIETTIPSYYFATRMSAQAVAWRTATRQWWDVESKNHDLVTSQAVIDELRRAPRVKAASMLDLVIGLPRLEETDVALEAASFYLEHRLVPYDAVADALHIALCSVHRIEFMLTWNCRHLANANKARHLMVLNSRLGLGAPIITTPYSLLGEHAP